MHGSTAATSNSTAPPPAAGRVAREQPESGTHTLNDSQVPSLHVPPGQVPLMCPLVPLPV